MKTKILSSSIFAIAVASTSSVHAQDATSSIHGFGIINVSNDYITPRGLMVTNKGVTIQVISGLVFAGLYHDDAAPINDVSLVVGTFNDINTTQHNGPVGAWNEFDWFAGPSVHIEKNWTLDVQIGQFLSPPGNFKTETNLETALSYDDSGWGLPVKFKPYVKFFYAISGDSTVVTGKRGGTYDVEIGIVPTIDLAPFTLSAPTWVTVGPEGYWGGDQNIGVFTTGLTLTYPLPFAARFGHWSAKAGFQYYNFINDQLRFAQTLIGTATPGSGGHHDEVNGFVGLSFGY